jgi:LAS superfamily LD-carboxypeptidase LdcB
LEKQQDLREDMEEKYGIEYAEKYAALPGYSEHHT